MKYDFDCIIDRMNTSSYKWDFTDVVYGKNDLLPMWIADMDFKSPQEVIDAMKERADHGIFGYVGRMDSYYDAITGWAKKRHNWEIHREWVMYSPGIVPAIALAVLALTHPGDKIIVQPPVYYPFFSVIQGNGRAVVNNPLINDNGNYKMDFEDLESKIDSRTKMLILCNPHNPVGRVWTREELEKLGQIALKYNLTIISDEIHSDIVYPGNKHIPIASISETLAQHTITCFAPSKTFNIAGLATSVIVIPNKKMRFDFFNFQEAMALGSTTVFGATALEASYKYGEPWLEELLVYLKGNIDFAIDYIEKNIPKVKVTKPQATFLLWIDFRELGMDVEELRKFLREEAKLAMNDGYVFGENGSGFARMNIGAPRSVIEDACKRLVSAVNKYLENK